MYRRTRRVIVTGATAAAALAISALGAGSALAATSAGPNGGGQASVSSISCTSAGNCAAVGYILPPGQNQVFVISEKNGTWGKSEIVPGMSALPGGSVRALLRSVSCSSAGNCSAGGLYVDHSGNGQAFVVSEKNGIWGHALEVPGSAALNAGGTAEVELMSCRSAGNCSAAGTYFTDEDEDQQAFVVTEKNGTWGTAEEVPGLGALNTAAVAEVNALSCSTAGSCTLGGDYDGGHGADGFVATQQGGVWGSAQAFPAIVSLNTGELAAIDSLSCKSAGNCTGVGSYRTASSKTEPIKTHFFAITETNGTWGAIQPIPGTAKLPTGGEVTGTIGFLSCPAAGDCTAGGDYTDPANVSQPFVVTEKNGVWGNARVLPGAAGLGKAEIASLGGLFCASAGNCTAAGTYIDNLKAFDGRVFVASEKNGTWGKAENLPGSVTLSQGKDVETGTLTCGAAGNCVLGGIFGVGASFEAPFLATQRNGVWTKPAEVPGVHS